MRVLLIFSIYLLAYTDDRCFQSVIDQLTSVRDPGNTLRAVYMPFDEGLQGLTKELVAKNAAVYRKALEDGDSHAKHLYAMGFRFDEHVVVPDLETIVKYYHTEIEKLIEAGRVSREDALFMSVAIRRDGEIQTLRVGETIDYTFDPNVGLLKSQDFYQSFRNGNFPLAPANRELKSQGVPGGESLFMHDLGHFTAFLEHPEYMTALQRRTEVFSEILAENSKQADRVKLNSFFAQEQLQLAKRSEVDDLLKQLPLPASMRGRDFYSVNELEESFKQLSSKELKELTSIIAERYPKTLENIGGAMRDIIIRDIGQTIAPGQLDVQYKELMASFTHGQRAKNLAILTSFLRGYSQMSPEDVLMSFDRLEVRDGSKLDDFIKQSGVDTYFGLGPYSNRRSIRDNDTLNLVGGGILATTAAGYYIFEDEIKVYIEDETSKENQDNQNE